MVKHLVVDINRVKKIRQVISGLLGTLVCLFVFASASSATAETRSLKLYYLHTGEKATITYKKNGAYVASGLKKVNWFLRDWRRNEPTKMDPQLLDLVWEAYRRSGSRDYIHIISAYRSPASNELLRKRGRGVAKNSQHTLGKAMDFFLPDVPLRKLREIGLKMQVGGVGYYPTSGSPFVHFDTGSVRHWPRMNRKELVKVFPDGKTIHVPSDGKPLARYNEALAAYKKRSRSGNIVPTASSGGSGQNFFEKLAALARQDEQDDSEANETAPAPRQVVTRTQTAAAPAQPVEPEKPEFASLPSRVPVPILAPRNDESLDSGTAVAVLDTANTEVSAEETVDGNPETPATALAAIEAVAVPVPAPRSQDTQVAVTATESATTPTEPPQPAPTETPQSVLALADARDATAPASALAPLSPSEIEDLRRSAVPVPVQRTAFATSLTSSPPTPQLPVPAIEVGDQLRTASPSLETAATDTPLPAQAATVQTAKLDTPPITTNAAEQPPVSTSDNPVTTSIPVPVPERRPVVDRQEGAILTASLDPKQVETEVIRTTENARSSNGGENRLAKRPISIETLSNSEINKSEIGKWALATDYSIRDLADVRAPAYGRNTVREVADIMVVQGFRPQLFAPSGDRFTGRAVNPGTLSVLR